MCFETVPQISRSFPQGGRASIMRWLIGFNKTCVATVPTLTDVADFASVGFPKGYNQVCDFPIIIKIDGSVFISVDQMKTWIVLYDANAASGILSGTMLYWAGLHTSVPSGWILCDGSAISRITYADLFAEIGTDYGIGDGSTTFNLPDMRGKSSMGINDNTLDAEDLSLTTRNKNDYVGAETHTLIESEMASHSHTYFSGAGSYAGSANNDGAFAAKPTSSNSQYTGGDTAHDNIQTSIALYPMIKT